ncbi:hypothetical protein AALA22_04775 [Anaerovoracaceae bacterium 41-7]|jgi:cytochrome c biogenesis protein CcdA|uniref:DUF2207 domain-containing protein n=1 Tax=Anaerotruncus colihominis TaxID=169435 RepID=A0A845QM13_9FIRM|nr:MULTISPECIES: hypothetical protein [Clostridia]MCI9639571.1 hypothetical protein [Emergencia sp.]NBH61108.1 hypothetical protein [Anaerotruncus colihominis]NCE98917.1 hypothetical protein [Emergencia sp. 1XD21-10]NCF01763.1 hypothetical protein [Anaerotruncus sp. 80]
MDNNLEKETQPRDSKERTEQKEAGRFKVNLAIYLGVFLVFALIILVTGILGQAFGKTVENIALIGIAIILVLLLIQSKRS